MMGAVQPFIPVIEYHLFKESIIELFCVNRDKPEMNCDGVCYLSSQLAEQEEQSGSSNLNTVYYPIGVNYALQRPFIAAPESTTHYFQFAEDWVFTYARSNSPPPRLS
jgi:hypothetical protein